MLRRIARSFVPILLVIALGGHWAFLQSLAWMGMVIDYSQNASLTEAIHHTFDGKHPCCLCKAIEAGKKSEQKTDFTVKFQRLEFPPSEEKPGLIALTNFQILQLRTDALAELLSQEPPTPPPRSNLA